MADAVEVQNGPPAVDQTGNLTIWWVPTILDVTKPKLTEISAGTRITYSFLPDGWNVTMPQEKLDDDRLTVPQKRQSLGKVTPTLDTLKYVDSTDPKSAAVVLAPAAGAVSKAGYFVERRGVPQTTLGAVADMVRVIDCSVGTQGTGPTQGDGKFSLTQEAVVNSITGPVAVVA